MSYLIVGPRYRGRFNADKAAELGVVGPDRSRLTRGETIEITVKVGEETVKRVIRPEDVLGKSENASVS
jgi:ribonuclease Z